MNTEILKKALIKGLPIGLVLALIVIIARMLITQTGFAANAGSLYGILSLICFPVGFVCYYYNNLTKKK